MQPNILHSIILAIAVAAMILRANSTQVMHRPDTYRSKPHLFKPGADVKPHVFQRRAAAKTQFGYFTNWSVVLVSLRTAQ